MTRVANIVTEVDDPGQYIMVAEVVDHAWLVSKPLSDTSSEDGLHMTRTRTAPG